MVGEQYYCYHNLKPGDTIVSRFKEFKGGLKGLVHYITVLTPEWAIHNLPETGVALISMDKVAEDYREVQKVERFEGGPTELECLIARAKKVMGRPYHLLQFNCESLANYLRYGRPESKQVLAVMLVLVLAIIALIGFVIAAGRRGAQSGGNGGLATPRQHAGYAV
jgi:Lecithin retinol acyltransferase